MSSAALLLGLCLGGPAAVADDESPAPLLSTGLRAAAKNGDVEAFFWFAEQGRGLALLESLMMREAATRFVVPKNMRERAEAARKREAEASRAYARARAARQFRAARAARRVLEEARLEVEDSIAAIFRFQREAAGVTHPKSVKLAQIQARLAAREAILLYVWLKERVWVCIVRRSGARIVSLAPSLSIKGALDAWDPRGADADPTPASGRLRGLLMDAIGLEKDIRRIYVSLDGPLQVLPFSILAPDRDVVRVPSASVLHWLRTHPSGQRGKRVLAVGDPDYRTQGDQNAGVQRSGRRYLPLPGTRREAVAVGDEVLLGGEATETGVVAALAKEPRWRAVHFACHSRVDTRRPTRSAIVTAVGKGDDGFLTALELARLNVPADLVVLSTDSSALGRFQPGEGSIGLPRAFLVAGTRAVLGSLWSIDDDATAVLMMRFHELWHPKEGKGLPAATALRRAKQHVRAHTKWAHAYYWAGWTLIGDPD